MKTANLAIVFTDIQGFSERTSRQTLEENERLLRVHGELLVPLFKAFGGRILKSIGDAFMVTFESPTQAVLSGMAIQDRLWQYNQTAPAAERLDVRVAINVGEVRLEEQDVFGEPVNIAARVESITEAGEVFFTEAVYLAMNKAEVPSREVGLFELKGIPGKIRVFRVPRGPYRMGAPEQEAPPEPAPERPPFGNLALSRVPESMLAPGDLATAAAQVGERLAQRTRTVLLAVKTHRQRRWPPSPRALKVGGAALALVLLLAVGGFLLLRDSPVEAAIEAAANRELPSAERAEWGEKARKLISEDKELPAGERRWLLGRLEEALQRPERAVEHYRLGAKAGEERAGMQLIEMLENPDCRLRVEVADTLGELRLVSARNALETLAKKGGAGEKPGLFGCDSREAAARALGRLGR
ncbi:adenylate/guanylate cyclase domain-containing protein [Cystobacter ferrugineus]|uniref:adenylate/guanylate cyclase domain-containing protein n=1 Tax=Cystobacter ferrugineus TaxID=83449 RepID=UPI000A0211A5|nr:adenylate/guanylate cyclase domain-containing protein [Cystobacter ferrugineus]